MPLSVQGILQNVSLASEQPDTLYPYLREVFINETPLTSRANREVADNDVYNIVSYDVRPRTYTLAAAFTASSADLDITLTDGTALMVGDVLEVKDTAGTATERVEVTEIVSGTVVNVRRARESTTVIANTAGGSGASLVVTLIGNSRTGAEIDQAGKRNVRTLVEQYVQTFQYAVQVGGKAQAIRSTRLPAGFSDVFSLEQKVAMTEMMRDIEYTAYYGIGEKPTAAGDRGKMKGIKKLISTGNVNTSGGASYTFLNFVAGPIQKVIDGGGDPNVCICSTDFMTGLQTWGFAKQHIEQPRQSSLGLPIREVMVPFASGAITFIPSYQLAAGTALVLTWDDFLMRYIRQEFWNQRGNRGDAIEGEWIASMAIDLQNPAHHAWVEGITAFSA